MDVSGWIHFFDSVGPAAREAVLALLARSGVAVHPMPVPPQGCGLMVCSLIDEAVTTALHEAGREAMVLVLVLAPSGADAVDQWALLRAGARDVLTWPGLPHGGEQIRARLARWCALEALCESIEGRAALIGTSAAWRALVRQVVEVAAFSNSAVLVIGESGTGKELIARLIHALDRRPDKRELIVVDCTTIMPELSGSEFFGHERGAFTGALQAREGAFAQADGGTLFLDEVGELSPALQTQLLRVVQEGKYKRVGSNVWQHTRFRLISATNRDLEMCVAEGSFRVDLYYRIAGVVCRTPPLRERRDDVLALARHFQANYDGAEPGEGFDEAVRRYLVAREYPGNVRELRRVVERLCLRHAGPGPITIGDVPVGDRPTEAVAAGGAFDARFNELVRQAVTMGIGLKQIGQGAVEAAIRVAIELEHGNLHRAARLLGVTDRALQLRRAQQRLSH